MKLLFTGPLLDFSGFAHCSRSFLRMLLESDLDVVTRALLYDQLDAGQSFEVPEWLQETLQKDLCGVDAAIQMTTCNVEAVPVPGIVNGLYTFFETSRLQQSWAMAANQFDFLIVPCNANAQALVTSGVTKPILVAAPPCDEDAYKKPYKSFDVGNIDGKTVFYNICQLSTKKGIDLLLRAYYAAFADMPDEVVLVLKTYIDMQNRANDHANVVEYINGVKARTRIPVAKFPPVMPLVFTTTDEEIHELHTLGDAYVCSSRAEGWGLPVFDALAHGNCVISHTNGGLGEFVTPDNALIYNASASLFYDMPHSDPGLFTGMEQCCEPSPAELAVLMRKYHLLLKGFKNNSLDEEGIKSWEIVSTKQKNAALLGERFDYRKISEKVVEQIKLAKQSYDETGVVNFVTSEETLEATL